MNVVVGLVALVVALGACSSSKRGTTTPTSSAVSSTTTPRNPPASPTVAFAAPDGIHVTNEARVFGGPGATRPRWSADGAWLAYEDSGSTLWVVRTSGGAARRIAARVGSWAWAPRGGRLAFVAAGGTALSVVDVAGAGHWTVPGRVRVDDFAWSRDGHRIAYSLVPARGPRRIDEVFVARLDTPERDCVTLCPDVRKVEFSLGGNRHGAVDVGVLFASWSPDGTTLLIWTDPYHSGSIAMDGLGLYELAVAGGTARPVTRTLVRREWIAWAPDGGRFATVESSGRMRGDKPRRLVVCTLAVASCHLIADTALDPAWSSDGARVAFVHADEHPPADSSDWPAEYARRALVVAAADGTDPQNVPDSEGAASPTWLDGHRILFVHDGGLWVLDRTTGRLSELVHAIGRPGVVPPPEPYEATDLTGYAWTNSFDVRGG